MPRKLAIDWDETELRIVAAQVSGGSVKVTDAAVIPLGDADVAAVLKSAIVEHGLTGAETLVAIGRGKAELRELQLPPVPDDELPDMVRFQAIRSFASAGDSATVDFLVTGRQDSGVEMIAAAIGPTKLNEIRHACDAAELLLQRISLRPLAAAALYLTQSYGDTPGDTVLVDLLAGDAEIVVARRGRVIFVRTVRMPTVQSARPKALAGELRRSLVACGSSGAPERVVLWGRQSVHQQDQVMLAEAAGSPVEVIDPFTLIDVDTKLRKELPEHVGRLAPLVGLLAADEKHADRLIDFLNPRRRIEETPNQYRFAAIVGVPIAVAVLFGLFLYSRLKGLDDQITELKTANAAMKPVVDKAVQSINRTESVDQFLDGDVNWLAEIRRLATSMPPSDQMIVRSLSGTTDPRRGGGRLQVSGAVTNPSVIDDFEKALRDETHRVVGEGASEAKSQDAYRWGFSESITVDAETIRNHRYAGILAATSKSEPSPSAPAPAESMPFRDQPESSEHSSDDSPSEPPPTSAAASVPTIDEPTSETQS